MNRVAWTSLGDVSVSLLAEASGVVLAASLVVGLLLVWECILVMRVVWQEVGSVGV